MIYVISVTCFFLLYEQSTARAEQKLVFRHVKEQRNKLVNLHECFYSCHMRSRTLLQKQENLRVEKKWRCKQHPQPWSFPFPVLKLIQGTLSIMLFSLYFTVFRLVLAHTYAHQCSSCVAHYCPYISKINVYQSCENIPIHIVT